MTVFPPQIPFPYSKYQGFLKYGGFQWEELPRKRYAKNQTHLVMIWKKSNELYSLLTLCIPFALLSNVFSGTTLKKYCNLWRLTLCRCHSDRDLPDPYLSHFDSQMAVCQRYNLQPRDRYSSPGIPER